MGEVSAEEISGGEHGHDAAPAWAAEASDERKQLAQAALAYMVGSDELATSGLAAVTEALGVLPEGIAVAFSRVARVMQEAQS
jgi:hypothetical protein